ncbi:MAG: diphthine--ammonia ligase [Segetibacter sp.]|nr:diphthine--ammonia ligase [Segetibacter sp.]
MNTTCSWSGGKDSCFALMQAIGKGYKPMVLLNVLNEAGKISRSHGIPLEILKAQAGAAGLPLHLITSSWQDYEARFVHALEQLTDQYKLQYAVFGDIDLQEHRDWEEKVCAKVGLQAILPLWKQDRRRLVNEMLESRIETIIVSCNEVMGERFLGRTLTPALIDELEEIGIDACGENGEYHTLVVDCPLFSHRLQVKVVDKTLYEKYWFCQLGLSQRLYSLY